VRSITSAGGDKRRKEKKIGGARARSSKNTSPVLDVLYLVDIDASFALYEELEVLESLITALPGQPREHDFLEKIIDPLHSLSGES